MMIKVKGQLRVRKCHGALIQIQVEEQSQQGPSHASPGNQRNLVCLTKRKVNTVSKYCSGPVCRFHCLLLCLAGYVGFGAVPRTPHPSKRQSRSATTSRENRTPKNGNSKKLATQELEIKHLNNLIFELQKENDSLKTENRTLKQASPPSIAVVFKISSSSPFALSSVYCVK